MVPAMASSAEPAADPRPALLRRIPSIDELAARASLARLSAQASRDLVVETAREVLAALRAEISSGALHDEAGLRAEVIEQRVAREVERLLAPSLRAVINATGVVLHTNLGRAPLSAEAVEHIRRTAGAYANLEYDLAAGARGRRDAHTERLLARVAGAEAAIVVNNNAAAVFLVLSALAKGGEVIVSRGELIEIGESFRIPDIMAESGAILREVGTTNRTRLADYESALSERTRLLLRVHPSNFRIAGFTERPELSGLVELGRRTGVPVFEDLGSGCIADFNRQGIEEPLVRASLAAGASVVSFSGDKLLGGPQAGVIAGKRELIQRIRKNPLFRALRVDKLTVAALEATLLAYLRGDLDAIPALRMIRLTSGQIEPRAQALAAQLRAAVPGAEAEIEMRDGQSVIGGGSMPEEHLPTRLVAISPRRLSAAELERRLRSPQTSAPVLARVEDDRLVLDLRTVFPEQDAALSDAVGTALQ